MMDTLNKNNSTIQLLQKSSSSKENFQEKCNRAQMIKPQVAKVLP